MNMNAASVRRKPISSLNTMGSLQQLHQENSEVNRKWTNQKRFRKIAPLMAVLAMLCNFYREPVLADDEPINSACSTELSEAQQFSTAICRKSVSSEYADDDSGSSGESVELHSPPSCGECPNPLPLRGAARLSHDRLPAHTPGASVPSEEPIVGNNVSLKYHLKNCEFAEQMQPSRRRNFCSIKEARDAGMRPCNWCFPSFSTKVFGQLIQHND